MTIRFVHILVEGQTEETFVKQVLFPVLERVNVVITPSIIVTDRAAGRPYAKGGGVTYQRVKSHVSKLLHDSSASLVTTMLDFYPHKSDFPGASKLLHQLKGKDVYEKVNHLQQRFSEDIGDSRFVPYFSLHELEALYFAQPERIAAAFPELPNNQARVFSDIRAKFPSPEHIDLDNPPSKRIEAVLEPLGIRYNKQIAGAEIASQIGLDRIRQECRHFNEWLTRLESLGKPTP